MNSLERPPALDSGNAPVRRKPRIMIAGEFSAGKTRLLNAIIGESILPSNVTSTSLPPMWLTKGDRDPLRLDTDDVWHELHDFSSIDVVATKFCVLRSMAPILDHFDLIDTPGNSDPNIPPECWERMTEFADMVLWCSNSNQAWRQSEKSVWVEMPERLTEHSVMVLTHADQLPDDRARGKVMRRVERDASEFFAKIAMISALDEAQVAGFAKRLVSIAQGIGLLTGAEAPSFDPADVQKEAVRPVRGNGRRKRGRLIVPRRLMARPADEVDTEDQDKAASDVFRLDDSARVKAPTLDAADDPILDDEPELVPMPQPDNDPVSEVEPELDLAPEMDFGPAGEAQPEPAPKVVPRVLKMAPAEPRTPPADLTEEELTRLVMAKTMETTARSPSIGDGPAARNWRRISQDADMTDPAAILECVRLLIAEMDGDDSREAGRLRRKA